MLSQVSGGGAVWYAYGVKACLGALKPVYSDTTQLNVEMSTRSQREQLSQTLYYDVINKNTTDLLRTDWLYAVQLGNWVS